MDIDVQDHRIASAAMAAPYLSREQETELATRWRVKDDSDARDDIAMAHLRLVVSMAGKFRGFGLLDLRFLVRSIRMTLIDHCG